VDFQRAATGVANRPEMEMEGVTRIEATAENERDGRRVVSSGLRMEVRPTVAPRRTTVAASDDMVYVIEWNVMLDVGEDQPEQSSE
jgi:hypothetical protein